MKKSFWIVLLLLMVVPSVVFAEMLDVPGVFVQHSGDCWYIDISLEYNCDQLSIIVEGYNKHEGYLQPNLKLTPVDGGEPVIIDTPFSLDVITYPPNTYVSTMYITEWQGGEYVITGTVGGFADGKQWSQFIVSGTTDGWHMSPKYPEFEVPTEPVVIDLVCGPPPGTGTPGYWKNHPEAWPGYPDGMIEIGGRMYSINEAIDLMNTSDKKDRTFTMFNTLVAAYLNIAVNNPYDCIEDAYWAAHAWMEDYPVGSKVKAGGKNSPWRDGEPLKNILDAYNNGLSGCALSRDVLEGTEKLAQEHSDAPEALPSLQNYPNPFNPVTTISFNMPRGEKATITIYNMLGEKVTTLADGYFSAGSHSVIWNANGFASGIYFYRFETASYSITNKLLFAK